MLRRVAEAKKIMEDQMMEELQKRKQEQLNAAEMREVTTIFFIYTLRSKDLHNLLQLTHYVTKVKLATTTILFIGKLFS